MYICIYLYIYIYIQLNYTNGHIWATDGFMLKLMNNHQAAFYPYRDMHMGRHVKSVRNNGFLFKCTSCE